MEPSQKHLPPRVEKWEILLVAFAVTIALFLGSTNLATPSLWHDEAVQVAVAKNIVATGQPLLPSGRPHAVAPVYNAIMAGFVYLFGSGEGAVRMPSVLFGGVNVVLLYLVTRSLLGRSTALIAAFALALSPWSLAWSRQARFYAFQQTLYLATTGIAWQLFKARDTKRMLGWGTALVAAYLLGIGTSLHSLLFLAGIGAYAFCMMLFDPPDRKRWLIWWLASCLVFALSVFFYWLTLPQMDASIVFSPIATEGVPWLYYLDWLAGNLGATFFILALAGTVLLLYREKREGLYTALCFWGPVLVLSVFITYRKHRFMYFAFPFYGVLFSYALIRMSAFVRTTFSAPATRKTVWHVAGAVLIVLFGARTAWSAIRLVGNSFSVARGNDTTLATRHPQFRKPCEYVRTHLTNDTTVLTDTFVTVLYYVGRVDNWYPNRCIPGEYWEAGPMGLKDVRELQEYIVQHPKGFFICEWFRFWHSPVLKEDVDWVDANMKRIDEACSGDVRVYSWGMN